MQSKDNTCPHLNTVCFYSYYNSNNLWEYTCTNCDKKANSIEEMWGSGQQEDNTGHPTAETPDAQPLENVSGEQFDGMRATPPYAPIIGPDGEELTFDEVTDSLRRFQFKVEHILEEATSRRQVDQAAEMLAWTARQLNRCAQDFVRLPEALPSNNASEAVRVDAPLTDSKPEKPPVNELGEILTKFSPDLTDVQHIKLMQAIKALISQKLVEELQNLPIGRTPTIQVEIINKRINEIEVSNG